MGCRGTIHWLTDDDTVCHKRPGSWLSCLAGHTCWILVARSCCRSPSYVATEDPQHLGFLVITCWLCGWAGQWCGSGSMICEGVWVRGRDSARCRPLARGGRLRPCGLVEVVLGLALLSLLILEESRGRKEGRKGQNDRPSPEGTGSGSPSMDHAAS